jgi:hypothetical protein
MSWFKHTPKIKGPSKLHPSRTSPITDKILKEIKDDVRKPSNLSNKTSNKE